MAAIKLWNAHSTWVLKQHPFANNLLPYHSRYLSKLEEQKILPGSRANIIDDNNELHACVYPLLDLNGVYKHIPPPIHDYLPSQSGLCARSKSGRLGHK